MLNLMFGFSLTAYADSWFMWKLFKPYFKEEEEEMKDGDERRTAGTVSEQVQ